MVLEKTLESPLDSKEIQLVHPKGNKSWVFIGRTCWSWNSNTSASSCKELTLWKIPWCWEGLRVGGEGDDRGWDGWMASPTRWTRVWVNSGSWWWTGRPGVLRFMGSQRVGHYWATELKWTDSLNYPFPMWFEHKGLQKEKRVETIVRAAEGTNVRKASIKDLSLTYQNGWSSVCLEQLYCCRNSGKLSLVLSVCVREVDGLPKLARKLLWNADLFMQLTVLV